MYLVLLETSGNQNYIFSTNKLKENIGASELTYRAGTNWVLRAVRAIASKTNWWNPNDTTEKTRGKLLDINGLNLPLESNPKARVEILVATSGKALLLVRDREDGKRIIRWVTKKLLQFAPGVDICGVISDNFDWETKKLGDVVRQVHEQFETVRARCPSQQLRFLRLPVVDECATSGLPAARVDTKVPDGKPKPRSAVSISKRIASSKGVDRIVSLLQRQRPDLNIARSLAALDPEFDDTGNKVSSVDWLAVVHADGNGLGEIFLNFDQHIQQISQEGEDRNRLYANRLREFSIALDICTEKAFLSAIDKCIEPNQTFVPIAPLVLGGDDLTVLCDAKYALPFTVAFLQAFEEETSNVQLLSTESKEVSTSVIPQIAEKALGVGCLSICAGIAIIKPHFPFSVAYELAEQLLKSAKTVKKKVTHPTNPDKPYPCSALDFHVLYDSSGTDLDIIRAKQQVDSGKTLLYNSPYVVTPIAALQGQNGSDWVEIHRWDKLCTKAQALMPNHDDDRQLPNSQIHALRSHLYLGKDAADGFYKLIQGRYDNLRVIEGNAGSLFQQDLQSPEVHTTSLLDAMNVMSFLNIEEATD